ncbi:hypothetical protein N7452_001266 [Penicillium brevicompactum]|nr:hypothetical protein N7452_001266 [Penicillium brevicompactum]
MTRLKSF